MASLVFPEKGRRREGCGQERERERERERR